MNCIYVTKLVVNSVGMDHNIFSVGWYHPQKEKKLAWSGIIFAIKMVCKPPKGHHNYTIYTWNFMGGRVWAGGDDNLKGPWRGKW